MQDQGRIGCARVLGLKNLILNVIFILGSVFRYGFVAGFGANAGCCENNSANCADFRFTSPEAFAKRRFTKPRQCGRGGIGRRAALRSLWGNTRGGSSPLDRTILSTREYVMSLTRDI